MSLDAAHQRTLAELARVQHERDELARFVLRLREQGALALGYLQAKGETRLAEGMRAALAGEIEPPDTEADAAEDAAYTQAVLRMQEAEAREDREERTGRPDVFTFVPLGGSPLFGRSREHVTVLATSDDATLVRFPDGYETEVMGAEVVACTCVTLAIGIRCRVPEDLR